MEIHPSVVIANTENVLTFDVIKVNKKEEMKSKKKILFLVLAAILDTGRR
jgi:hypothetical protein